MAPADVAAVKQILEASPEAAQWAVSDLEHPVWPQAGIWVAEENSGVAGMVAARSAGGEAEILNLAVAPLFRRRGLGKALVEAALAASKAHGAARIFLEVRESNADARLFYAGLNFTESGRRSRYYRDPAEDALVLARNLD